MTLTTATETHVRAAAQAALPRRDRARRCASSSATATSMQVPGLTKIVVNMGVGEAARDAKLIEGAVRDLTAITGQKPPVHRGPQVHRAVQAARGHADRRARDAARRPDVGVPRPAAVDRAPAHPRLPRAVARSSSTATATTPSVSPSSRCSTRSTRTRSTGSAGMDITVVTTATHRRRGAGAAAAARLPLQGELTVAEEGADATRAGPSGKPKFKVRGYTRCQRCGRPHVGLPHVRALPDLRPGDGAPRASCPASPSPAGNRGVRATGPLNSYAAPQAARRETAARERPRRLMTMTDPIADMLTRIRNANSAYHDTVAHAATARSRRTSPRSSSRRATSPAGRSRTPEGASARSSSSSSSTARTGSGRSPGCAGSASPACGSTRRPTGCPRSSAASASRSSRRRPAC